MCKVSCKPYKAPDKTYKVPEIRQGLVHLQITKYNKSNSYKIEAHKVPVCFGDLVHTAEHLAHFCVDLAHNSEHIEYYLPRIFATISLSISRQRATCGTLRCSFLDK